MNNSLNNDRLINMSETKLRCHYCGSNSYKYKRKIKDFFLYKCTRCNLLFTGISISEKLQTKTNFDVYSKPYIDDYISRSKNLKKRFSSRISEIEEIKRGGRLLDLGCGIGLFLETVNEYSSYNWELFGVDVNDRLIKTARERLPFVKYYCGTLSTRPFSSNYFDCVTCFDVLEHDLNLKHTLVEIKRVLKPNGLLVVQVPNRASLMAYLCDDEWDWWSVPDHIFHFTPKTLTLTMEDYGFRLVKTFTWDPAQEFVSNIRGTILMKTSQNFSNRKLTKALTVPFYLVWIVKNILEKRFNLGGLMVMSFQKT